MMKRKLFCIGIRLSALALVATGWVGIAAPLRVVVDASDLPRGLLTAEITVPTQAGRMDLYYPQWIEGVHGPNNPVSNLAGLEVTTPDGRKIPWNRDPRDVFRFQADAGAAEELIVRTTYICNQSTANSTGIDSHGTSLFGIICWNTCLLYPVGESIYDLDVDLTVRLPEGWSWASSLREKKSEGSSVEFERVSFQELMDSPLICGEVVRTRNITPTGGLPHTLAIVAESKRVLDLGPETLRKLTNLVEEATLLFGRQHNYPYTFLLALSDNLPFIGLEHTRSSLNAVGEKGFEDDEEASKTGQLLAHEYGHRWCGKYHRPAGMNTEDYNTPKDTRLLWVYEGLDQYIGVVLAARSGLFATKKRTSFEGALRDSWMGIGRTTVSLMRQKGRRFVNLEDTAASSYLRRSGGKHWRSLKRPQDYYFEGALLWFEIDAILREETNGKITLDDFIMSFLGRYDSGRPLMPFTEEDVLRFLNELHPHDWKTLIDERVRGFNEELPLKVFSRLGYRVEYSPKPTDFDRDASLTALGMSVGSDGVIQTIVPGSTADTAALAEGDKIVGVNKKKFGEGRLKDAIAESPVERRIELLILKGEVFETVFLPYADGPKYIDLVRKENAADVLSMILAPKREDAKTSAGAVGIN